MAITLGYSEYSPKADFNSPDLLLGTWWEFSRLDRSNGLHFNDYHGQFIPQIPRQLMRRYTKFGDMVLDMFLGSGTTMVEAARMGRPCIGVDLRADLWPEISERISLLSKDLAHTVYSHFIEGDSASSKTHTDINEWIGYTGRSHVQLVILHPPYHNIIKFSEDSRDLSRQPTVDSFLGGFTRVANGSFLLLEEGRFAALVIGDIYQDSQVVPLGFLTMQAMQAVGFTLKSIIVKNITGNERGKGKNGNLWKYRALAGGFSIFEHEYIFVFQKPRARKSQKRGKKAKS